MGFAISITMEETRLPAFHELLATGFLVSASEGESIRDFLLGRLALDADYVASTVQTVFLNGRAVDDFDRTGLPEGAVLALSSAMPGLVGAVFRCKSPLSPMRGIEAGTDRGPRLSAADIEVTVKLFNRVAADLGPCLFAAGLRLPADRLLGFLRSRHDLAVKEIRVNEQAADPADLPRLLADGPAEILLTVKAQEP
jgi:hypothetical protein